LSADNQFILAKGATGQLGYWQLEENRDAVRLNIGIKKLNSCYITPNYEYLIIGDSENSIELWNLRSKVRVKTFEVKGRWSCISVTHNSKYIIMQREPGEIVFWNTELQEDEFSLHGHYDNVSYMVTDHNDSYLYSAGFDGRVMIYDLYTRQKVFEFPDIGVQYHVMTITQDDRYLLACTYDNFVRVIDINQRKEIKAK